MRSLSDDVYLVKVCCKLEYPTMQRSSQTTCWQMLIVSVSLVIMFNLSRREIDREKIVQKCSRKSPTIAGIVSRGGSWPKLWDSALHLAFIHTTGLRNLSRLIIGPSWAWSSSLPFIQHPNTQKNKVSASTTSIVFITQTFRLTSTLQTNFYHAWWTQTYILHIATCKFCNCFDVTLY